MMNEESDALVIARWCWPGNWKAVGCGEMWGNSPPAPGFEVAIQLGAVPRDFFPTSARDIHDAELVLVERGHAEAYGAHLAQELLACDVHVYFEAPGTHPRYRHEVKGLTCRDLARAATAPLDARVRAMAAVIKALSGGPT